MSDARSTIATALAETRALLLDNYSEFEGNEETLDGLIGNTSLDIEGWLRDIEAEELLESAVFCQDLGYAQGLSYALQSIDGKWNHNV